MFIISYNEIKEIDYLENTFKELKSLKYLKLVLE